MDPRDELDVLGGLGAKEEPALAGVLDVGHGVIQGSATGLCSATVSADLKADRVFSLTPDDAVGEGSRTYRSLTAQLGEHQVKARLAPDAELPATGIPLEPPRAADTVDLRARLAIDRFTLAKW